MKSRYTITIETRDLLRKLGLTSFLSTEMDVVEQQPFDAMVVDIDESHLLSIDWSRIPGNILALVSNEKQARLAFDHGAVGILSKEGSPDRIPSALRAIEDGLMVIEQEFMDSLAQESAHKLDVSISTREKEVLALLCDGLGNKEIASRLYISIHTVKFHIQTLMKKLGTQNRTQTAVIASRMGLI